MSSSLKRLKTDHSSMADLPSSIIVKFSNQDGAAAGPNIDIPVESNTKQLELLLNQLLGNSDPLPYAFYIDDTEVDDSIRETLKSLNETSAEARSFEQTINISYHPLSVFRVRPVTRCVETMPGHTDAVLHVSYSPDGKRLASGGGDMTVRFWNVVTSMPVHTCSGHRHHVLCTAWSPDGLSFVSADRAGEIRVWDPRTGEQKGQAMKGHTKWITSLSFEPFHVDPKCCRLASSSKDHTVKIWTLATGICSTTFCGHTDSVECVKWGGAGLLYTCSRDRTIKVWAIDSESGRNQHKLVRTLSGHAHRVNTLALHCDYILRTGPFSLGDHISSSRSKKDATIGTTDSAVGDGDDASKVQQAKALEKYQSVVGSDGERIVSCSDDFTLFLWTPQESKTPVTRMTGHQQLVNHIAFSPDGRFIASASFDKKVKLWCGRTGKFLFSCNGHVGAVYQVAWSPDSAYLVSASKDSTVKLWGMKATGSSTKNNTRAQGKPIATLPGHEDEIYSIDWSPNSSSVASGSKDRTIKIWNH